MRSNILNQNRL